MKIPENVLTVTFLKKLLGYPDKLKHKYLLMK